MKITRLFSNCRMLPIKMASIQPYLYSVTVSDSYDFLYGILIPQYIYNISSEFAFCIFIVCHLLKKYLVSFLAHSLTQ